MKKIDKILDFIFGLAFIVIIAGGWFFSAIAYNTEIFKRLNEGGKENV